MNKVDYTNSIVNLSNSILKHFGAPTLHNSIKEIDDKLLGKKKVIVFLFDGMGKTPLEKNLKNNSFFRSHIIHTMYSTFPATTVASTNSFLSGQTPIEHGWLAWTLYFKDINKNVNVFPNVVEETGESLGEDNLMRQKCPYEDIASLINKANNKDIARIIMGYPVNKTDKKVRHLRPFIKHSYIETMKSDESFTYAYWVDPDMSMHKKGVTSLDVKRRIKYIERLIKKYSSKYDDIATLVIADHGMIDVKFNNMNDHKDLVNMFSQPISMEKRSINFFIKDEYKDEFPKLFTKYYGKHYEIFSTKEALEKEFFGDGKPHKMIKEFLGDYIAIAKEGFSLECSKETHPKVKFLGHHAGGSLDELLISVIGINLN